MSFKHLFQRAMAGDPERLHFAAHSHHLWPDASYVGQIAAWTDAARLADSKWDRVMNEIWPAAQLEVARELHLPDPSSVVFGANTHELLLRVVSALPDRKRPIRILASDGEFHSFTRQAARWVEAGTATVDLVPADALLAHAVSGEHDLIFCSHVQFGTGRLFGQIDALASLARPDGPWVILDGYHGFMAVETDLSAVSGNLFYLAGGYKYAMAGEGCAFLHAPAGFAPRPQITGWFAEFEGLEKTPGQIGYAEDARRFMGATFDPSGIYRFVAVRDMLASEGLTTDKIADHVDGLRSQFLSAHPLQAELLNPASPARFVALKSPKAAQWQRQLAEQDIVTDVRGDVLRIGFGLYQDPADVDQLLWALKRL